MKCCLIMSLILLLLFVKNGAYRTPPNTTQKANPKTSFQKILSFGSVLATRKTSFRSNDATTAKRPDESTRSKSSKKTSLRAEDLSEEWRREFLLPDDVNETYYFEHQKLLRCGQHAGNHIVQLPIPLQDYEDEAEKLEKLYEEINPISSSAEGEEPNDHHDRQVFRSTNRIGLYHEAVIMNVLRQHHYDYQRNPPTDSPLAGILLHYRAHYTAIKIFDDKAVYFDSQAGRPFEFISIAKMHLFIKRMRIIHRRVAVYYLIKT